MEAIRRIQSIGALIILLCLAAPAQASVPTIAFVPEKPALLDLELEQLPERLLPQYSSCVADDRRWACYDLEQQMELNRFEARARAWHAHLVTAKFSLDTHRLLVLNFAEQQRVLQGIVSSEQLRNKELTKQLMVEIEEKHTYKAKADQISWWPLALGGAAVILAGGMVVGVIASR